ncbi:MAG TPA: sigma-70 family RNA polymerase sigma factor [Planctomycetota bacterium]|nr:sigma-70 family RNA polymerase sigma factor [Planctomycetota bacterium]
MTDRKALADRTDGELLALHLLGEDAAFASLVGRHSAMVLAACRRALGPAEAEDAAQAVFVILARKAAALRPEKSLAGWLHRTARMVSGTALRERSRRRLHEEEAAAMRQAGVAQDASIGAAVRAELLARLDGAIGELQPRYREVVTLCHLEGLSQSEAAVRLGMPLGTVAVYSQRGLEALRRMLGGARGALPGSAPELTAARLGELLAESSAQAAASVPSGFMDSALSAAKNAAAAAPPVALLAQAVLKALFWHKVQVLAVAAAAVLAVGAAAPLAIRAISRAGSGESSARDGRQADRPQPPPDRPPPPPGAPERGEDVWEVDCIDSHMEATWAGGTDMLLRLTEQLVRHPDTDIPVACTGSWDSSVDVGRVPGSVRAVAAVDIGGRGQPALFAASDAGDRVFARDVRTGKFADQTATLKLGSRSAAFAWGDFTGSGRLDLASSDGKGLVIWAQAADGTFASTAVADVPKVACTGLAAVDVGQKGRAGLAWGSAAGVVLLVPEAGKPGVFALKPLPVPAGALKDAAGAGAPLAADFDGDGLADIIQPFAGGSVFYKGLGAGAFAGGAVCDVRLGEGRTGAFLGDFDMDGRLDIMTVAEDTPRLWQNAGGGRFKNEFHLSGELTYISKPGAIGGNVCDINGDGRQDIFLAYPEEAAQVFFNRGYRSFGHAHKPIDLAETGNLPGALKGAQAGVLADLNGDGAQDMALALADGSVVVLPQTLTGDAPLAVRVALAPGAAAAGPVTVSAVSDRRPLGAWAVSPGTGEALFCRADAGEVTVTWQLPGSEPRKKTLTLEKRPIRFVIGTTGEDRR